MHKERPTVKHGGGDLVVWECFSLSGTDPVTKIDEKMDRFMYRDILENTMLPCTEEAMPNRIITPNFLLS